MRSPFILTLPLLLTTLAGCKAKTKPGGEGGGAPPATATATAAAGSGGSAPTVPTTRATKQPPPVHCPKEMVLVGQKLCVDRYEAALVDKHSKRRYSPYYPPMRRLAGVLHDRWDKKRVIVGGPKAQSMPLPALPGWQRRVQGEPLAVSRKGKTPNGYVSGVIAERACKNAGKRLCTHREWKRACRGEQQRDYPYGKKYKQGKCNIFRFTHPAAKLHDNASIGHLDPRLNLVKDRQGRLLRPTGGTPSCASRWGKDAIYDMNGNLDEWVKNDDGQFVGGFFSRAKKDGCNSSVSAHGKTYFDYSTGVRCCKDASK